MQRLSRCSFNFIKIFLTISVAKVPKYYLEIAADSDCVTLMQPKRFAKGQLHHTVCSVFACALAHSSKRASTHFVPVSYLYTLLQKSLS